MSKVCVVTYEYNNYDIQWGIEGNLTLMGVFESKEIARQSIKEWVDDNPEHWIVKDINAQEKYRKQLRQQDRGLLVYFNFNEVDFNEVVDVSSEYQCLADWWYEE